MKIRDWKAEYRRDKAINLLKHASWHCRFGSKPDNTDRQPTTGDIDAANICEHLIGKIAKES